MSLRLSLSQPPEDSGRPLLDGLIELTRLDERLDFPWRAIVMGMRLVMIMAMRHDHLEVGPLESFTHYWSDSQLVPGDPEFAKFRAEMIERQTHVEKCSKNHVARDAVKRVEVKNLHLVIDAWDGRKPKEYYKRAGL